MFQFVARQHHFFYFNTDNATINTSILGNSFKRVAQCFRQLQLNRLLKSCQWHPLVMLNLTYCIHLQQNTFFQPPSYRWEHRNPVQFLISECLNPMLWSSKKLSMHWENRRVVTYLLHTWYLISSFDLQPALYLGSSSRSRRRLLHRSQRWFLCHLLSRSPYQSRRFVRNGFGGELWSE